MIFAGEGALGVKIAEDIIQTIRKFLFFHARNVAFSIVKIAVSRKIVVLSTTRNAKIKHKNS